jgi:hypothetical protein
MTGAGTQAPGAQGLYDPRHEHDACGVGFVVNVKGRRSHAVIKQGLQLLINLLHRGACGCEANTGDGAGILIQMPDRFLRKVTGSLGIQLPEAGQYGAGLVFLPRNRGERRAIKSIIATILEEEDLKLLGWREATACSARARSPRSLSSSTCSSGVARVFPSTRIPRPTDSASNASCTSPASASSTRSITSRWPRSSSSTWSASRRAR